MAFFYKEMRINRKNKIHHFIVLSVFFHVLVLLNLAGFLRLNHNYNEFEVFIINDLTKPLRENHKTSVTMKNTVNAVNNTSIVKLDQNTESENQTTETITDSSFSLATSQKTSSNNVGQNLRGENSGIVDTEFGNAYGPKFIYRETPVYPQIARRLGKEGRVTLRLTINERGELMNIEVIEGAPYGFTESAIEALKKSKFSPAIKDGKPIACRAILTVRFILKN